MNKTILLWDRHSDFPEAKPPDRAHVADAGLDFFAAEDCIIARGEVKRIRTGICVSPAIIDEENRLVIPPDYNIPGGWTYALLVWDKSGLGSKGLKVLGGVVDESYRGEVQIILGSVNLSNSLQNMLAFTAGKYFTPAQILEEPIIIRKGEKVAQVLLQRVELPIIPGLASNLITTARGTGGFGSTGK